jgi:hypothetical protein
MPPINARGARGHTALRQVKLDKAKLDLGGRHARIRCLFWSVSPRRGPASAAQGRQVSEARWPRLRHPDRSGRMRGPGSRQGKADRPRLAIDVRRRSQSEDPDQCSASCSWRRAGRPSLHRNGCGTRLQFRRADTPGRASHNAASAAFSVELGRIAADALAGSGR